MFRWTWPTPIYKLRPGFLDASTQKAAYLIEFGPATSGSRTTSSPARPSIARRRAIQGGLWSSPSELSDRNRPKQGRQHRRTRPDVRPLLRSRHPGAWRARSPGSGSGRARRLLVRGLTRRLPGVDGMPITCRDSVSPGGFLTFTLQTDTQGNATSTSGCYSGDGPDHSGHRLRKRIESRQLGSSSSPPPPPPPPQTCLSEQENTKPSSQHLYQLPQLPPESGRPSQRASGPSLVEVHVPHDR